MHTLRTIGGIALLALSLVAGSFQTAEAATQIRVGASPTPHAEILKVAGELLKEQGYSMAVLSNCGIPYAKTQWETFGMDRWFDAFFQCESFDNAPKEDIIKAIASDYEKAVGETPVSRKESAAGAGSEGFLVIGDRNSDLGAAKDITAPFIGCVYGYGKYGELDEADVSAGSAKDIRTAVSVLCGKQ